MDRQEALEMFLSEVKRLNEEEHVDDLCKARRYDELARVECRICNAFMAYMWENPLKARTEEIPKGSFFATALLTNLIGTDRILDDEKEFAVHLAEEAGKLGKSLAWRALEAKDYVSSLSWQEFFDDSYAKSYDDEYGEE